MVWNEWKSTIDLGVRRKVYLSYERSRYEEYRKEFETRIVHKFIVVSAEIEKMPIGSAEEYMAALVGRGLLSEDMGFVALLGPNADNVVDWELQAAFQIPRASSCVVGLLLPDFPLTSDGSYRFRDLPPSISTAVKSGSGKIYTWDSVSSEDSTIIKVVEEAFID